MNTLNCSEFALCFHFVSCMNKGSFNFIFSYLLLSYTFASFPFVANDDRAHQGFGWVGEWANTGSVSSLSLPIYKHLTHMHTAHSYIWWIDSLDRRSTIFFLLFDSHEFGKGTATNNNLTRLQTLYHADKQKTDKYILELVIWLNRLISILRYKDHGSQPLPTRFPTQKGTVSHSQMLRTLSLNYGTKTHRIQLSQEEQNLLDNTNGRRLIPGISKSQEFAVAKKKGSKVWALCKSTGNSPNREMSGRHNLDHPKANILDVMDGLDSWYWAS